MIKREKRKLLKKELEIVGSRKKSFRAPVEKKETVNIHFLGAIVKNGPIKIQGL
jgi:hypothetical protein